jgi:hypothetical protein
VTRRGDSLKSSKSFGKEGLIENCRWNNNGMIEIKITKTKSIKVMIISKVACGSSETEVIAFGYPDGKIGNTLFGVSFGFQGIGNREFAS